MVNAAEEADTPTPPPGDNGNDSGKPKNLLTSVDDIDQFDKQTWEVLKGLPIRTGSILRVSTESYHRWKIGLTDANKEMLAFMAAGYRIKDYEERERNSFIEKVEATPLSKAIRNSMARMMALAVKAIMLSMDDGKREFHVCDLACGLGKMSSAVAAALRSEKKSSDILSRTVFHLVDLMPSKLPRAHANIDGFKPKGIWTAHDSDEDFLQDNPDTFDIVLSLCHLHKKPFPNIYTGISGAIREGGSLVSGDWHSSMCDHPRYVFELLEKMSIESDRLQLFEQLFGDLLDPQTKPKLTAEEEKGIEEHQRYWAHVYSSLVQSPSTAARMPRHYILGAFDTTDSRERKLKDVGLETDIQEIRAHYKGAKLFHTPNKMSVGADRASVTIGLKKPRR